MVLAGIEEFPVNRVLEFSIKKIGSQRSHIEQLQSDNERLIQDRETALTVRVALYTAIILSES